MMSVIIFFVNLVDFFLTSSNFVCLKVMTCTKISITIYLTNHNLFIDLPWSTVCVRDRDPGSQPA